MTRTKRLLGIVPSIPLSTRLWRTSTSSRDTGRGVRVTQPVSTGVRSVTTVSHLDCTRVGASNSVRTHHCLPEDLGTKESSLCAENKENFKQPYRV